MEPKLLNTVKDIFGRNKNIINPSLYLDKYTGYREQSEVKEVLRNVTNFTNKEKNYEKNINSLVNLLIELPCATPKTFECITPFTIHLSRTTVLENTGICFHPIYGFVYIPGSGIKGLARAYARDILKVDEKLILEIFGNENDEKDKSKLRAGKVVFHDAYPVLDTSYQLNVEINNCHHQEYYNGNGQKEPGDWENPNPTYFLSVKPGAKFNFILSLRQDLKDKLEEETNIEVEENNQKRKLKNKDLVSKAFEILAGALAHLGLGAKTAAGFGYFNTNTAIENNEKIIIKKYNLILQTPAFLANSEQGKDDADLTSKTLRGLLRWWWRTIYYGKISNSDLLSLESAIWGSTEKNSPISIHILSKSKTSVPILMYGKKEEQNKQREQVLRNDEDFFIKKGIEPGRVIPFNYFAYGTNEMVREGQNRIWKRRYVIDPPVKWEIIVHIKKSMFKNIDIKIEEIKSQFEMALWLLSNYGGVGAKNNKGFGSIKWEGIDNSIENIEYIKKIRVKFLNNLRLSFIENSNYNCFSSLDKIYTHTIKVEADNVWQVINHLAIKYYKFMGDNKHKEEKKVFGLPRKVHGPLDRPLNHQRNHLPPKDLTTDNDTFKSYIKNKKIEVKDIRHPSPIHFHIEKSDDSYYIVKIIAFTHNAISKDLKLLDDFFNELKPKK